MATINENLDTIDEIKTELKGTLSILGYSDVPFSEIGTTLQTVVPELTSETQSALTSIDELSNNVISLSNSVDSISANIDEISSTAFLFGKSKISASDIDGVEISYGTDELSEALSTLYGKYLFSQNSKLTIGNNSSYDAAIITAVPGQKYSFSRAARFVCQVKDGDSVVKYEENVSETTIEDDAELLAVTYSNAQTYSLFMVCKGDSVKPTLYETPKWINESNINVKANSAYESIDRIDYEYARYAGRNLFDECKLLKEHALIENIDKINEKVKIIEYDLSSSAGYNYNVYFLKTKKNTKYTFLGVNRLKPTDIFQNQISNGTYSDNGFVTTTVDSGDAEGFIFAINPQNYQNIYKYIISEGDKLCVDCEIEDHGIGFKDSKEQVFLDDLNLASTAVLFKPQHYVFNNQNGFAKYSSNARYNCYLMKLSPGKTYTFSSPIVYSSLLSNDMLHQVSSLWTPAPGLSAFTNDLSAPYICFSLNSALSGFYISEGDSATNAKTLENLDFLKNEKYEYVQVRENLLPHLELLKSKTLAASTGYRVSFHNYDNYNTYVMPVDGVSEYSFTFNGRAILLSYDKKSPVTGNIPFSKSTRIDTNVPNARYMLISVNLEFTSNDAICKGDKIVYSRRIEDIEPLISMQANLSTINEKLKNFDGDFRQKYSTVKSDYVADGLSVEIPNVYNTLKKNWRVCTEFRVKDLDEVIIGRDTERIEKANFFKITPSELQYFANISATPYSLSIDVDPNSGLSGCNNIQLLLEKNEDPWCYATIFVNGNLLSTRFSYADYDFGKWYAKPIGCSISSLEMSWQPQDIDKKTWIFGDSWFTFSPARWPYWLYQYGYSKNALIDGFPGENSGQAAQSLSNLLNFGYPKDVIVCTGMNDGADSSDDVPSQRWVAYRDEILSICQNNGLNPVFATIPSTPTINNNAKNSWIKNSGYRYIDFEKAVGADIDVHWYPGMQNIDFPETQSGNHPTELGAKALLAQFLTDFPEIMKNS